MKEKIEITVVFDPAKRDASLSSMDWPSVQAALIVEFGNALIDAEKEWKGK